MQESLVKENLVCLSSVVDKIVLFQNNKRLRMNGSKLFCFGGVNDPSGVFLVQDFLTTEEIKIPSLPVKLLNHASTCFNKTVYCLDGKKLCFRSNSNTVWQLRLDLKPLKWKKIASLNEDRHLLDAVIYQDRLFVVVVCWR